mmetsp:Transcript_9291/g.13972  ORF Transcript_9291/g.13972 Transcript_9291/m.13972 type:complete len:1312 (-) Transcript_9291:1353-5288(-)
MHAPFVRQQDTINVKRMNETRNVTSTTIKVFTGGASNRRCTRRNGTFRPGKNLNVLNYTSSTDPLRHHQCDEGYQCVNAVVGKYGRNSPDGVCLRCNSRQSCPRGTIGKLNGLTDSNLCPDGYICSPLPKLCELGTVCKMNIMLNCTEVREKVRVELGLGDIYAGMYCPQGSDKMLPCDAGFYCPDSVTKLECPIGFFCPLKSAAPMFQCQSCPSGSKSFVVSITVTVFICVMSSVTLAMLWLLKRLRTGKTGAKRKRFITGNRCQLSLEDTEGSFLSDVTMDFDAKESEQWNRLRPILHEIVEKVKKTGYFVGERTNKFEKGVLLCADCFDAAVMFDVICPHGEKAITAQHLNLIMGFSDTKLYRFMSIISKLEGASRESGSISRNSFVKHFVNALDLLRFSEPSSSNAANIFKEMDSQNAGVVKISRLYKTSLRYFLEESQIYCLIQFLSERVDIQDSEINTAIGQHSVSQLTFVDLDDSGRPGDLFDEVIPHDGSADLSEMERHPSDRDDISWCSNSYSSFKAEMKFALPYAWTKYSGKDKSTMYINEKVFVAEFPKILSVVTSPLFHCGDVMHKTRCPIKMPGSNDFDLVFEDLSVVVGKGSTEKLVLNNISGRIEAGKMTAVMGASGSGKSTFLNALCGRISYGTVTGKMFVNGNEDRVDNYRDVMGFVPQDDIMFSELTVRENLAFSGRFRLPRNTSMREINELVDEVLAILSLHRVEDSIVGDVLKRGLSGGEKKRVSIGIELMAQPRLLVLDEPTSGLDSMSAMCVMQSLKSLVDNTGITVAACIHQPRKSVFYMFDSLYLLGRDGKMIYFGATKDVESYFSKIGYNIPYQENVADWVIDICSGLFDAPKHHGKHAKTAGSGSARARRTSASAESISSSVQALKSLYEAWGRHSLTLGSDTVVPSVLPEKIRKPTFIEQTIIHLCRNLLIGFRNTEAKLLDCLIILCAIILTSLLNGPVEIVRDTESTTRSAAARFDLLRVDDSSVIVKFFPSIFALSYGAYTHLITFAMQIGAILGCLVAFSAVKHMSENNLQFYREAGSGYNINAYFVAMNITSIFEQSIQMFVAAGVAFFLRGSVASFQSYLVHFLALGWIVSSWAFLFVLIVPRKNLTLATGFLIVFSSLCLGGQIDPIKYEGLYDDRALSIISGALSPTRYFAEGLVVGEHRCLPAQYGLVIDSNASANVTEFPRNATGLNFLGLGLWDNSDVVTQSFSGWYWGLLPSFMVGLTIRFTSAFLLHLTDRPRQLKRPLLNEMMQWSFFDYVYVLFSLFYVGVLYYVTVLLLIGEPDPWRIVLKGRATYDM